jgi:hypothetical protein
MIVRILSTIASFLSEAEVEILVTVCTILAAFHVQPFTVEDLPLFGRVHDFFDNVRGTVETLIVGIREYDQQFTLELRHLCELDAVGDQGLFWDVDLFMRHELTAGRGFGVLALLESEADEFFQALVAAGFDDGVGSWTAGMMVIDGVGCKVSELH